MNSTDQIGSVAPALLNWVPLFSALLGAIIGSVSAYFGNSLLETRKRKLDIYSQLQGKKRALGQIYFSIISERFVCERFDAFKEKCGTATDPTVDYELKRHTESADKYQFELNKTYSATLELLSSIELVFKKSEQLNKKIETIIKLNDTVKIDEEKMRRKFKEIISEKISPIRPKRDLLILPEGIKIITTYSGKDLVSATDPILDNVLDNDLRYYINSQVEWPLDNLLTYLKKELQGEDNEELQAWRVRILP